MPEENIDQKIKNLQIQTSQKAITTRKKSYKKYWIIGIILILLIGYFYRSSFLPPEIETGKVIKIEPPEIGDTVLTVSGYVIPNHKVELAPKLIGRVKWIGVDKGDVVKKGQEIVRIEDREYQAMVDQARARLSSAKARLTELKTGSRTEEIKMAEANLHQAETNFSNSETSFLRIEKLFKDGAVSKERFDNSSTEYAIAKSALESAKQNYQMVKTGPRDELIKAAEADVKGAEASLEYAETQLSDTIIRAPLDGTIMERLIEVGEMVTNTSYGGTRGARVALLSLADLNDLEVEIDLNESDLHKVKLSQTANVSLEAFPDISYKGEVTEIAPEANRQKATVQVKVKILNPDKVIKPEMNAKVSFLNDISPQESGKTTKIYIPNNAIVKKEDKSYVFVVNENRIKQVQIEQGKDSEFGIEVNKGLQGNEIIAVKGLDKLEDGSRIRIKKS